MSKNVIALSHDPRSAQRVVQSLRNAGFDSDSVSVVYAARPDQVRIDAVVETTKAPDGVVAGASAGGAVGGTLGWLVGVGALVIPGLDALLAAGPILSSLSGAAFGAAVGGVAGALIGLGVPAFDARRYQRGLEHGEVLLSVRATSARDAERARAILDRGGARSITLLRQPILDAAAEPWAETTANAHWLPR